MIFDYADLGCAEVINSVRAAAYASAYCLPVECDACPDLPDVLGHPPYTDPVTDDAPWYDPLVPESADVLGYMGLDAVGFRSSTIGRDPVQLVGDGAALGVARRSHRQIVYTLLLIVRDECALAYGLEWLAVALEGADCGGSCSGDTLTTYACCPTGDGSYERRYLYDVALLEGPSVTAVEYLSDAILAKVTFTLAAGKPWVFREPLTSTTAWHNLAAGASVVVDPDDVHELCVETVDCLEDPDCPPPLLPTRPPSPVDDCYPTGPATFRRTLISIPPEDMYQWLETVPVLELETGSSALRRLVVRFWANPTGGSCTESPDPCGFCGVIQIPYLPAGAVLRVDGRVQRAEVECSPLPGSYATSTPIVYGPQGRAFEWPAFDCPSGLCIEILSTAATTAPDSRARVLLAARADVG
ncbi:hypothetical protein ABZX75_17695 [Streptomyces sp. NPDC003038]|uniref:hypothetical protein n=1 Tax=unclassified Streptomyces TaxID=2593676 RepID=UPI0033A768E8